MVVGKKTKHLIALGWTSGSKDQMMPVGKLIAGILILAGGVFFLQGMRVLPSQVMYGKPEWVVIGAIMVLAGIVLAFVVNRRGGQS
jgi:hypothetical protein